MIALQRPYTFSRMMIMMLLSFFITIINIYMFNCYLDKIFMWKHEYI